MRRLSADVRRCLTLAGLALAVLLSVPAAGYCAVQVAVAQVLTPCSPLTDCRQPQNHEGIVLRGGGGESVTVQLVIGFGSQALRDISFVFDVDGLHTAHAWRAWSIWNVPEVAVPVRMQLGGADRASVAGGAIEDAVVPRFDLPDVREGAAGEGAFVSCPVYVECELPRGKAGQYAGTLTMLSEGRAVAQIPVRVDVLPYDLPMVPDFIVEMNSYGDWTRLLAPDVDSYLAIHRLFRRFRTTFTQVPYRQDGSAVLPFMEPVVTVHSGGLAADWQAFREANGPLFDGTAFADGQPVTHFVLPFRYGWPAKSDRAAKEGSGNQKQREAARNDGLRQAVKTFLIEQGWLAADGGVTGTRFQEFHNENPEHGSSAPWFLDEPRTMKDMEGHGLYTGLSIGGFSAYRIDVSDWRRVRGGLERVGNQVDDWFVSTNPLYLNKEAIAFFHGLQARREAGRQATAGWLFGYGELPGFVREGNAVSWAALVAELCRYWSMGLDGYAQWITDVWKPAKRPELPLYARPLFFANAGGARTFFWPGRYLGVNGPLPSLRLFAVRQAVQMTDTAALVCKRYPERCADVRVRMASLSPQDERDVIACMQELQNLLSEHGEQ
ncbi:hypothetical protein N1030_00925 [Desulfovibrio mangrovi]|uniref:hypothetical protein n=1 Tax=Desulfovibrio mangrovi TaxID=2976983 RepID=UPI0022477CF0|nr:hypothetical protein [Desulfovibrio mangrovi]UZP67560.1 hypothetical protein N1030_00925 [Desulfovibrio mangrovi]